MFTCAFHPQTVAFPSPLPPPPTPLAPPPPRAVLEGRLGSVSVFENILSPPPLLEQFSSKPSQVPLARNVPEQGEGGGLRQFLEIVYQPPPQFVRALLEQGWWGGGL